jgi:hypothetical protein
VIPAAGLGDLEKSVNGFLLQTTFCSQSFRDLSVSAGFSFDPSQYGWCSRAYWGRRQLFCP